MRAARVLLAAAPRPTRLRLVMGVANVPKKAGDRGEDAFFADHSTGSFAIADGAGSWAREGVDAGEFSRSLLERVRSGLQSRSRSLQRPDLPGTLHLAWEALMADSVQGSCTVLLGQLHGDTLALLHLGDSGAMVARPTELMPEFLGGSPSKVLRSVYRSTPIVHKSNMPFQLSSEDEEGLDFQGLDLVSVRLRPGDLVVAGCDGLFDNMADTEIEALVLEGRGGRASRDAAADAQGLAQRLCDRAAEKGRAEGGKLDDVTVFVAEALPWTASSSGELLENFHEAAGSAAASAAAAAARSMARSALFTRGNSWYPRMQARASSSSSSALAPGGSLRYQPLGGGTDVPLMLGRPLGQGSYAEVWELLESNGVPAGAVLKCFRPAEAVLACLFGEEYRKEVAGQYERERQAGIRLHMGPAHPGRDHVAQVLSCEVEGDVPAQPMLVIEHAGQSLEGSAADGLSLPERLQVVEELLKAVTYLGLLGIVHCDVSQGNCCIAPNGSAKLVDFGSAALLEGARSRRAEVCPRLERLRMRYLHHPRFPAAERYGHPLLLSRLISEIEQPRGLNVYAGNYDPDHFAGSLAAAPPEALRGVLVPGFSDVYGVGVLLWQLLTGEETPFEIDVECDRVRFIGWDSFFASSPTEQCAFLRDRLESALLPQLRASCTTSDLEKLARWLSLALAEAPESRAEAVAAGNLLAVLMQDYPMPRATFENQGVHVHQ